MVQSASYYFRKKDADFTFLAYLPVHGGLKYTFGYRFETPDLVIAFGGDGRCSRDRGMFSAGEEME